MSYPCSERPSSGALAAGLLILSLVTPYSGALADVAQRSLLGTGVVQISTTGVPPDLSLLPSSPAVAYNSIDHEFLVVWTADREYNGEFDIWGRRVDASTGALLGADDIRISRVGEGVSGSYDAFQPAVVYNPQSHEYFVVWSGTHYGSVGAGLNDREIFGQRLTAAGQRIAPMGLRISTMGPDGSADYPALSPAVAWDSNHNSYLVVWSASDDAFESWDQGDEIHLRVVKVIGGTTFLIGNQERVSWMNDFAWKPDVVHNPISGEYLVVWVGLDGASESYIYGQRIADSFFGNWLLGGIPERFSNTDPGGEVTSFAGTAVTFDPQRNRYFVVWGGGGTTSDFEIYGQLVQGGTGAEVGADDFLISDSSLQTDLAMRPDVAYDVQSGEYLVVWSDENWGQPGMTETFGRRISAPTGQVLGVEAIQISTMGPAGQQGYWGLQPAVASGTRGGHLVVWRGREQYVVGDAGYDDIEIFGERLAVPLFADDFELGNTTKWSALVVR